MECTEDVDVWLRAELDSGTTSSKRANVVCFDLSDYLIHFGRPLKADADDAPDLPEDWGWINIAEDVNLSPFFLLRRIVRHGRVWGTWLMRNGRRMVYGPRPAVCFTEMPLPTFVQASQARSARGENLGPYGTPAEDPWTPDDVAGAIARHTIDVARYFEAPANADQLVGRFDAAVNRVAQEARNTQEFGEIGECWLWMYDNKPPLVRALVRDPDRLVINNVGRYLVSLPEFGDEVGLRRREDVTKMLADIMETDPGVPAGYFGVLGSRDPDALPFYCTVLADRNVFFNESGSEDKSARDAE